MIIGRENEQTLLSDILHSQNSEFLVVYGRRRIGKTFLIESFFLAQDCMTFHTTGIQKGAIKEQLREFSKEIGHVFYGGAKIETPLTWMQAFESLHNAIKYIKTEKPITLFLDEFPWMATPRSRLLQALEYYWNRFWKNDKRIKLIICGSSAAWIIKKIIHHKGGLHNRITQKLNLKPFSISDTKRFLNKQGIKLSDQKLVELYFIVGGVPYYINQIKKNRSIAQNINAQCFQKDGLLFDEFSKVFSSLFKEHEAYEELVKIIAKNRHGTSRENIEKAIKRSQKGGTLTSRLQDLEMVGFIKGFLPVNHSRKGLYYRIYDEYSYFYLKWIAPEKRNIELEIEDNNFWLEMIKTPEYQSWRGYAFESFCYKHVSHIKKALGIVGASKIGAWRYIPKIDEDNQGAQIDLLFDRNDDAVTICEIKFSDKPFTITKEYAEKLKQKVETYQRVTRTKKQIFIAMISANGIKKNKYSEELVSGVVILDDLFKEV